MLISCDDGRGDDNPQSHREKSSEVHGLANFGSFWREERVLC